MSLSAEAGNRPSDMATAPAPALPQAPHIGIYQESNYQKFSFPIVKAWGNQRVLRCVSVNGKGEALGLGSAAVDTCARDMDRENSGSEEEVRGKLLVHLREAADRIKVIVQQPQLPPSFKGDETRMEAVLDAKAEAEAGPSSSESAWPWKLRTRRRGSRFAAMFERQPSAPPLVVVEKRATRPNPRSMERSDRPNCSITLTREEIDEDIYAVTGFRARRRPRKRPRIVQKQLDVSQCSFGSY